MSSLPFVTDDPPKAWKSGGIQISDTKARSLVPLSTAIVASNFDPRKEDWSVKLSAGE